MAAKAQPKHPPDRTPLEVFLDEYWPLWREPKNQGSHRYHDLRAAFDAGQKGVTIERDTLSFAKEKRALRAEYMAGKVDWLHVVHVLEGECGMLPEESRALADRWKVAKERAVGDD